MKVSEQINKFIEENGGNERDALNVALARLEAANREIERLENQIVLLQLDDEFSEILNIKE